MRDEKRGKGRRRRRRRGFGIEVYMYQITYGLKTLLLLDARMMSRVLGVAARRERACYPWCRGRACSALP